jgi:hypothetical protein
MIAKGLRNFKRSVGLNIVSSSEITEQSTFELINEKWDVWKRNEMKEKWVLWWYQQHIWEWYSLSWVSPLFDSTLDHQSQFHHIEISNTHYHWLFLQWVPKKITTQLFDFEKYSRIERICSSKLWLVRTFTSKKIESLRDEFFEWKHLETTEVHFVVVRLKKKRYERFLQERSNFDN